MFEKLPILCTLLALCVSVPATQGAEIDFSGLPLNAESYWNGSDESGGFTAGGLFFNNDYTYFPQWGVETWSGWAYSNKTSTVAGYDNQYAAITGGGITGAGSNFAIAFVDMPNGTFIDLGVHRAQSMKVTNTAYAYHSMKSGDSFARKFTASDWFLLRITGFTSLGATGSETGSIDFLLASGTNILDQWTTIDLSSLPAETRSLGFSLTSSDVGTFGMNTPAYFAMGSLTVAPEPGTVVLTVIAGVTMFGIVIRRRRAA